MQLCIEIISFIKIIIKVFKDDFRSIWNQTVFVNQGISVGFFVLLAGWLGEVSILEHM